MEWEALLTGVLSSAVVSTAMTTWWSAKVRREDLQRENAKEADRLKHVYFGIALQLEAFSYRCMTRISEISDAQDAYITYRDLDALGRLSAVPLQFDTDPKWVDLPVAVVDEVKTLEARYFAAGEWIADAFQMFADPVEASDFEVERLAYYGREASRIAKNTRNAIGQVRPANEGYDAVFASALDRCRELYIEHPDRNMLPELRKAFAAV